MMTEVLAVNCSSYVAPVKLSDHVGGEAELSAYP
jgi:hypothetical protein